MELLKSISPTKEESDHWMPLDTFYTPPELLPLDNFRQKLERALQELGRVDYSLNESVSGLRADASDTHDLLQAQITGLAEPELKHKMAELAGAIKRTIELVDGVVADNRVRKQ